MACLHRMTNVYGPSDPTRSTAMTYGKLDATKLCEIAVFSLERAPKYKALSYCWGEAEASKRIPLNGQPFHVRPNVWKFLLQLHQAPDSPWVFIDAICINQQDRDERSSQVDLMGDVYRFAWEVIALLATEDDLPPGFTKLKLITDFHKDYALWQKHFDALRLQLLWRAATRLHGCPSEKTMADEMNCIQRDTAWDLVIPLAEQPIWTRLWVIQEVLLAQRLTFWYDTVRVDWNIVYELMKYGMADRGPIEPGRVLQNFMDEHWYSSRNQAVKSSIELYNILQDKIDHGEAARRREMTLSSVVLSWSGQQCSVVDDKIYGLLGMTTSVLQPNYAGDTSSLFQNCLLEGLLELMYQYEKDKIQRGLKSAEFVVKLATALGQDIHDSDGITLDTTKYCLAMVGQNFAPTSILWARVHSLQYAEFKKFGALGERLYKKLPNVIHKLKALKEVYLDFAYETNYSRDWKRDARDLQALVYYKRRFSEIRQFNSITESVPQIHLMTAIKGDQLLAEILAFPDRDKSVVLAEKALQWIQTGMAELRSNDSRLEQDHIRKLQEYEKSLTSRLHMWKEDVAKGASSSKSDIEPQRLQDLRLIMDFFSEQGFTQKFPKDDGKLGYWSQSALSRGIYLPEVMRFVVKIKHDDEFAHFSYIVANTYPTDDGKYVRREFDDPAFQSWSVFEPQPHILDFLNATEHDNLSFDDIMHELTMPVLEENIESWQPESNSGK